MEKSQDSLLQINLSTDHCFMCLQQIPVKNSEEEEEEKNNITTEHDINNTDNSNNLSSQSSSSSSSSLFQNLCKQLNINIVEMIKNLIIPTRTSSSTHYVDKNDLIKTALLLENIDIRTALCSSCSHVIAWFSSLYLEQETIQMELDSCLCQLHKILERGDIIPQRIKMPTDLNSMLLLPVTDQLRKEITEKCSTTTFCSRQPKLFLKRILTTTTTNQNKSHSETPPFISPKIMSSFSVSPETFYGYDSIDVKVFGPLSSSSSDYYGESSSSTIIVPTNDDDTDFNNKNHQNDSVDDEQDKLPTVRIRRERIPFQYPLEFKRKRERKKVTYNDDDKPSAGTKKSINTYSDLSSSSSSSLINSCLPTAAGTSLEMISNSYDTANEIKLHEEVVEEPLLLLPSTSPSATTYVNETVNKKYICPTTSCKYTSSNQSTMKEHYRTVHLKLKKGRHTNKRKGKYYYNDETTGRYLCDFPSCTKDFSNSSSVRRHYQIIHLNNKKRYQCQICKRKFVAQESLKLHKLQCSSNSCGVMPYCRNCKKSFNNRNDHLNHICGIKPPLSLSKLNDGENMSKIDNSSSTNHDDDATTTTTTNSTSFQNYFNAVVGHKKCEKDKVYGTYRCGFPACKPTFIGHSRAVVIQHYMSEHNDKNSNKNKLKDYCNNKKTDVWTCKMCRKPFKNRFAYAAHCKACRGGGVEGHHLKCSSIKENSNNNPWKNNNYTSTKDKDVNYKNNNKGNLSDATAVPINIADSSQFPELKPATTTTTTTAALSALSTLSHDYDDGDGDDDDIVFSVESSSTETTRLSWDLDKEAEEISTSASSPTTTTSEEEVGEALLSNPYIL